jgi:FdrA protein
VLVRTVVKPNMYFDSVTLMRVSGQVGELAGVMDVMVGMGTDLNKESLANVGMLTEAIEEASPNDLLIGVRVADEPVLETVLEKIESLLASRRGQEPGAGGERL